jgi:hypothetical protein
MNATQKGINFTTNQWYTKTIAAGAGNTDGLDVTGDKVFLLESTEQCEMRINSLPWFKAELGLGYKLVGGDAFSHIEFKNLSASKDLKVDFYAGTMEIIDYRLNVRRNRDISVITRPPCPFTDAYGSVVIAATSQSPWYNGTSADGRKRFQFFCSNMSAAGGPIVYIVGQQSANAFVPVFPQTTQIVQASDNLIIVNTGGAPCTCVIGQTFYPDPTTITV